MSTPNLAIRTVGVGLLVGILGMILTFQRQIGLGFTLFGLALLGDLIVFARLRRVPLLLRNLIMVIPVLFFTLMLTIRSDPSLILMNICAALVGLLLLVYFFHNGNLVKLDLLEYPLSILSSGIAVCTQPLHELTQSSRWLWYRREDLPLLTPVLRGAVITVPVLAVFVVLLSAADEVFSRMVSDVLHLFTPNNAGILTQQILYSGVYAWIGIGILSVALIERKVKRAPAQPTSELLSDEERSALSPVPRFRLGFTESVMLLSSICVVFAAFVMIQFVYLFGGERNIANYSYADYVHRGFIELVVVAVLTLALALTLNANTIRRTSVQVNIGRGLSTVLILLTSVILASAFERLHLYELTYGFTSLRLCIYVFIGWLGFTFAGFILSLYWLRRQVNIFGLSAMIAVLGFTSTLDLLNPDYFVAWQNIQRGDIDPLYFSQLSGEAVPALITLIDAPEPGVRRIVRYILSADRHQINQSGSDWRDFNLDRSITIAALDSVKDQLDSQSSSPTWRHPLEDFSGLHNGMTVREIIRQFGFPNSDSESAIYGRYSTQNNSLSLIYQLLDDRLIELQIDSADGLNAACVKASTGSCSSLPIAH